MPRFCAHHSTLLLVAALPQLSRCLGCGFMAAGKRLCWSDLQWRPHRLSTSLRAQAETEGGEEVRKAGCGGGAQGPRREQEVRRRLHQPPAQGDRRQSLHPVAAMQPFWQPNPPLPLPHRSRWLCWATASTCPLLLVQQPVRSTAMLCGDSAEVSGASHRLARRAATRAIWTWTRSCSGWTGARTRPWPCAATAWGPVRA